VLTGSVGPCLASLQVPERRFVFCEVFLDLSEQRVVIFKICIDQPELLIPAEGKYPRTSGMKASSFTSFITWNLSNVIRTIGRLSVTPLITQ
jgi:hypothetical protein